MIRKLSLFEIMNTRSSGIKHLKNWKLSKTMAMRLKYKSENILGGFFFDLLMISFVLYSAGVFGVYLLGLNVAKAIAIALGAMIFELLLFTFLLSSDKLKGTVIEKFILSISLRKHVRRWKTLDS